MLSGLVMSKTMMGILLSMQRLKAVESITCKRFASPCAVGQVLVSHGIGKFYRILVVDAVHFCRFEDYICANLVCPQGGGRVGREKGIACAGNKNDDMADLQVAGGPPQDERLGHVVHFDGCLHTHGQSEILEGAHEREAVYDRCQHAHIIRCRTVHPTMGRGQPAPNVASPDDDGEFYLELLDLGDLLGEFLHDLRRNIFPGTLFAKSFATELKSTTRL